MKLNLKAFLFSLVVLPNFANGQTAIPDRGTLMAELQKVAEEEVESAVYGPVADWDVSKVTYMRNLFSDRTLENGERFTYGALFDENGWPDISGWNVGLVTDMVLMFSDRVSVPDITPWNVESVGYWNGMFQGSGFDQDISKWNVASATSMVSMFSGNEVFDQDISNWNVAKVHDIYGMFRGATAFNQNLVGWNVKSVTRIGEMFEGATQFNQNMCSWSTALPADLDLEKDEITDQFSNTDIFTGTSCSEFTAVRGATFCQKCSALEMDWNVSPLRFEQTVNYLKILSSNRAPQGVQEWKMYGKKGDITFNEDPKNTCLSYGGVELTAEDHPGLLWGGSGITAPGDESSLIISFVKGIEVDKSVYLDETLFFCVVLGLKDGTSIGPNAGSFLNFEELAFKVTMQLNGDFTVDAIPVGAKEVVNQDALTNYGVRAYVGACEDLLIDLPPVVVYNQGAAVPICVCPDETFTTVTSFTTLNFASGDDNFPAVTADGIVSTSSFDADFIVDMNGRSCKQIDSLLPEFFYNADTNVVVASGTVELDIGGRRRTAEVNLRSLQNVEEKEFGAEFKLAPATVESESSAMSCYGMIAGMASLLLAAAMI